MCNLFKKKPKPNGPELTTLYVVTQDSISHDIPEGDVVFYTIATSRQACEEYINKRLFIENQEHYTSWCELKGYDKPDNNAWQEYVLTGSIDIKKYMIAEVKYKIEDVAAIFRMFNRCMPIGTSYDTEIEIKRFTAYMSSITKELEKDLEKKTSA